MLRYARNKTTIYCGMHWCWRCSNNNPDDEAAGRSQDKKARGSRHHRRRDGRGRDRGQGRADRLLQGRDRAAVQGLRGLRDVLKIRLPRRQGQILRSGQKVQKAPEIRPG